MKSEELDSKYSNYDDSDDNSTLIAELEDESSDINDTDGSVALSFTNKEADKATYIGGTINPSIKCAFNGNVTESRQILEILRSEFEYDYIIIQRELCSLNGPKSGTYHYHFMVKLVKPSRVIKMIQSCKQAIDSYVGITTDKEKLHTTQVHVVSNHYGWIGYLYKDRSHDPLLFNVEKSVLQKTIDKGIETFNKARKGRDVQYNTEKNGLSWIHAVVAMMNAKKYKVNVYTRDIHPDPDEFWYDVSRMNFQFLYGMEAHDKLKKLIDDPTFHVLPEFIPDINYISFKDGYYNIPSGLFTRWDKNTIGTINACYTCESNFKEYCNIPKIWLKSIRYQNWGLEEFKRSYSKIYYAKIQKEKVLAIYGNSNCGKTTLMKPVTELYKNCGKPPPDEGKFTYGGIAAYPVIFWNEFSIPEDKTQRNMLKNILEGEVFTAPTKHRSGGTRIPPKRAYLLSNCNYDQIKDEATRDSNLQAILNRMDVFRARKVFGGYRQHLDLSCISNAKDEAVAVCVYCTQKDNYIDTYKVQSYFNTLKDNDDTEAEYVLNSENGDDDDEYNEVEQGYDPELSQMIRRYYRESAK